MSKSFYVIVGLVLLALFGGLYLSSDKGIMLEDESTRPSGFPSDQTLRESVENYLMFHCDKEYDHWRTQCGLGGKALYDHTLATFVVDDIEQTTASGPNVYRVWFTGEFVDSNNGHETVTAPIEVTRTGADWDIDPYIAIPAG